MTADIQDQQGGFDPWWKVKTGGSNVEQSILWKCDVGKIFQSTDGGQSWNDATPTEDPPNTWSDTPAPTIADLTFTQRVDNIHTEDWHCFLANATIGGQERAWMLITTDSGITWTWFEFDNYLASTVGSAITTITFNGVDEFLTLVSNSLTTGQWYALDGNNGPWYYDNGTPANFPDWQFGVSDDAGNPWSGNLGASTLAKTMGLVLPDWDTAMFAQAIDTEYARLIWRAHTTSVYVQAPDSPGGYGDNTGTMDVILKPATPGISDEFSMIWADVDTQDGTRLYLTAWADDTLVLQRRDTTLFTLENEVNLGDATFAEVGAFTWWAGVMTPAFNQDVIFAFGRMDDPQGLGSPVHLIWSQDGGDTWASLVNSFGADHISSFQAWQQGDVWRYVFVRNISGGNAEFWGGTTGTTPAKLADLPFQVNVDAMSIYNQNVAVGAKAVGAGGEMVMESRDLGQNWTDITGSLPTDGSTKSLVYV